MALSVILLLASYLGDPNSVPSLSVQVIFVMDNMHVRQKLQYR